MILFPIFLVIWIIGTLLLMTMEGMEGERIIFTDYGDYALLFVYIFGILTIIIGMANL